MGFIHNFDLFRTAVSQQCCIQLLGILGTAREISACLGTKSFTTSRILYFSVFNGNHGFHCVKKRISVASIEIQIHLVCSHAFVSCLPESQRMDAY